MRKLDERLDLSTKFIQMGQALMEDGDANRDSGKSLMGTILIFFRWYSIRR